MVQTTVANIFTNHRAAGSIRITSRNTDCIREQGEQRAKGATGGNYSDYWYQRRQTVYAEYRSRSKILQNPAIRALMLVERRFNVHAAIYCRRLTRCYNLPPRPWNISWISDTKGAGGVERTRNKLAIPGSPQDHAFYPARRNDIYNDDSLPILLNVVFIRLLVRGPESRVPVTKLRATILSLSDRKVILVDEA